MFLCLMCLPTGSMFCKALQKTMTSRQLIMAHPAVSGALTSSPHYGFSHSLLLGKLNRYAGADFSLFPSPYGSVALPKRDALAIYDECTKEDVFKPTFAVPSAGIHPGMVPLLMKDFGIDHIINAGGGFTAIQTGRQAEEERFGRSLMPS